MPRHPQNAPGAFWLDSDVCVACSACFVEAPENIRFDEAVQQSYVFKQPATDEELAAVREAVTMCPVEAIVEE